MDIKKYNVFFHLHTISGIIISALLYVIFFAGSFSFFKDDIANWERNDSMLKPQDQIHNDELLLNADNALRHLNSTYNLYGRDLTFNQVNIQRRVNVSASPSKDTLLAKENKLPGFFYLDSKTYEVTDYVSAYNLSEFLYRLHFFAQIPYPYGYYLSGFVALFFLFAIVTGILIHWNKIVSNFFVFRPWAKLKTLWTDAHTALGVLGIPFQFVLAVTGSFFMIKALLVIPNVQVLYDGNINTLYEELGYTEKPVLFKNEPLSKEFSINELVEKTEQKWEGFHVTALNIQNFGTNSMQATVSGELDYKDQLSSSGSVTYKVSNGSIINVKNPKLDTTYIDIVKNLMYRLHFGDYGGYGLRIISFILGLLSCFVIITGVLIWKVARDKKTVSEKKRRFNSALVNIYLAVCLSMYPVTALAFILVKVINGTDMVLIYQTYFISWLLLTVFFICKKSLYYTNKATLLIGSILGFSVPLVNGFITGNWFWKSAGEVSFSIFFIDVFWLVLSVITFLVFLKLKRVSR